MAVIIFGLILYLVSDGAFGCDLKGHGNIIKIIDGEPASIVDYPYYARYRPVNESNHCGATIVNERYLVTAAHCVMIASEFDDYASRRIITVGTDKVEGGGEDYEIEKTIIHPYFFVTLIQSGKSDFDIAIIKLKKNLTLSDRVKPIKMAGSDFEMKPGDILTTMGFGQTEDGMQSLVLLKIDVPYIDPSVCRRIFKKYGKMFNERMLCSSLDKKISCHGDSGGPIVYNDTFVGVVSWGNPACGTSCAKLYADMPAVYTRISEMESFIDGIIKE